MTATDEACAAETRESTMWQVEYHRDGQSHLFDINETTEDVAIEWMNDLFALAMVSWVVVYAAEFTNGLRSGRRVHAVKDKTGKCPVRR
jgi:hypothetical protein